MTFEEWWNLSGGNVVHKVPKYSAQEAWNAAWDQQQRVIDEMHLMFKDHALVPKEPTLKMVAAGLNHSETMPKAYKAMIQAAQEEK